MRASALPPARWPRPPAEREEISLREQLCRSVGAGFELRQSRLGFGEQPDGDLVRPHQIFQRRGAVGELCYRLLEVGEQVVESTLAQVAVAATRPRMPLTNRPACHPRRSWQARSIR